MRAQWLKVSTLSILGLLAALTAAAMTPRPQITTSSFSIIAYDPLTGELGTAAASEAPLIGMNLEFFELDVGGVVVHGGPHLEIAERTLIALRDGLPPERAIAVGLAPSGDRERRQVLALSTRGAAAFTGDRLQKFSVQEIGEDFAAAGQRLPNPDVVSAMVARFRESDGPLADRLLDALGAGRDAAGEEAEVHSAALMVIGPAARFATRDRKVDLRIDFVPNDAVEALLTLRAQVDSVYGIGDR